MKIKVEDFVDKIENDQFQTVTLQTTEIPKRVEIRNLQQLFQQFQELLEQNTLGQVKQSFLCEGEPVMVSLESGIINLPFANSNKVDNFFENQEETAVIINLIVEAEDVNASGLRIDSFGTVADYLATPEKVNQELVAGINTQLELLVKNKAAQSKTAESEE
ncbi:hypothetical protein [Liquorilactobacillus capillatus]|uniref:Uncharacterized protein n=1 Tax=Liquorilactobacillus capillatus DSM 19910 TaxID=1423731 RepID=A0A0R1LYG7_9LACO|nr:hypothetical protein [Liquorilactobacillus capillatus]KRL00608.1 hypothetical protein FC81_GL001965 [Liquorilactobacillus capillatus DSM 19910]